MKLLGEVLKKYRKESGYSLREAAEGAHMTASYLLKIERGDFSSISLKSFIALSALYEVPASDILAKANLIEAEESKLPDLPQYLRLKYGLGGQAIRDMEMAMRLCEEKYNKLVDGR